MISKAGTTVRSEWGWYWATRSLTRATDAVEVLLAQRSERSGARGAVERDHAAAGERELAAAGQLDTGADDREPLLQLLDGAEPGPQSQHLLLRGRRQRRDELAAATGVRGAQHVNRHAGGAGGRQRGDLVVPRPGEHHQPGHGLRGDGRRQVRDARGDRPHGRGGRGRGRRLGRHRHGQQFRTPAVQPADGVGERGGVDDPGVPGVHLDQPGDRVEGRGHDPRAARTLRGPVLRTLSDGQQRLRAEAGDLAGDRRRVAGIRARPGGEQHRCAERDRGGGRPGLPAGVAVGRQHDDGGARVERGAGGDRQRYRRGGREDGRRLRGTAENGRGARLPDRLRRRAPGEHRAGRHQDGSDPGPPAPSAPAPPTCSPTASTRPGDPPIRPHMPTVGAAAPHAHHDAHGSLRRGRRRRRRLSGGSARVGQTGQR